MECEIRTSRPEVRPAVRGQKSEVRLGFATRERSRCGFTLVELLVVMVIISILIAVAATVVGSAIGNARIAATKGTITKINGLVQERVRAIDQAVSSSDFTSRLQRVEAQFRTGPNTDLVRIVAMKEELKRAFYGTRANGTLNYPPAAPTPPPQVDAQLESSKLLYAALTKGAVHGVPPVDTDTFSSNEVKVDPSDDRSYFVDAWGEPLRFYLFPTRLVRPSGAGTGVNKPLVDLLIPGMSSELLQADPQDPERLFANWAVQTFQQNLGQIERFYHTLATFHVPLIVSAGADRELGLNEPFDSANFGHLAQPAAGVAANPGESAVNDNITNHQRAGGN